MANKPAPVIVIFGITGDLSKRKLLPSLYHLFERGLLSSDTQIIGTSRKELTKEDLLHNIETSVSAIDEACKPETLAMMASSIDTIQIDPEKQTDYKMLKAKLDNLDQKEKRGRLFYMSIPPTAYAPIIKHLSSVGLNTDQNRILLEKPFGYNLASAQEAVSLVSHAFSEEQIYRIDHYLAKETAQNLLAFRQHNPIFVPLWNNQHIECVHVRQFETIGIEGRANFYEQTGALRDMIQSHLMQLLALTLMDIPEDMTSESIHKAKLGFLEQLDLADPKMSKRGQYENYRSEVDNLSSNTETYVRTELSSQAEHWKGVELILEHGKAMNETIADITIAFKSPRERRRNSLTFTIQPNEGISLDLVVKEPGLTNDMKHTALTFRYKDVFSDAPTIDAYERVLMDAINGDQSLFASDAEVLTTWRILEPLLDAWTDNDHGLIIYPTGTGNI
jgi:glucose-6-phosphate 1-dehydrogenase